VNSAAKAVPPDKAMARAARMCLVFMMWVP
jgi:hypothetical protein